VVEQGPVAQVLATPRHPYTRALLDCIPHGRTGGRMRPVPGALPNPLALPAGCRFHPRCVHAQPPCTEAVPALEEAGLHETGPGHVTRCLRWREVTT